MQYKNNGRIVYLDLLRILATFAVIFLHVVCQEFFCFSFSRNWYISVVGDSIVRWCVPVFVMISGTLFLIPSKNVTYREILRKRLPRLLIAYFFWTIVYYFLFDYHGEFSIKNLLSSHFHLWFMPMLMGVYLLIPILRKIAIDKNLFKYSLAIWLAFILISFLQFITLFKSARHFHFLFNMNSVVGFSGYCLLGYYLSQVSFSKRQRILIYIMGIVGALVTIFGTLYMSIKMGEYNERYFANLSIQVAAMASALFVLVKGIAPRFGNGMLILVDFVRKDLFGIYLVHALWLEVFNTYAIRHCFSIVFTLPLITLVVFICSLFTTKLIRLVPGLRKVVE